MFRKHLIMASLVLLPLTAQAEESEFLQLQRWLFNLTELFMEKSEDSSTYLQNYLQCMDDEQALRESDKKDLSTLLDNAFQSGNACAPLINDWLETLSNQPIDQLSEEQKKKLLKESL